MTNMQEVKVLRMQVHDALRLLESSNLSALMKNTLHVAVKKVDRITISAFLKFEYGDEMYYKNMAEICETLPEGSSSHMELLSYHLKNLQS